MNNQIGCLYKTVRLWKGITKKEVVEQVKISRVYLTKIEDATEVFSINQALQSKIQKALGMPEKIDNSITQEFRQESMQFYIYVNNENMNMAKEMFTTFQQKEHLYENSFCYAEYLLISFIYNVSEGTHNLELSTLVGVLDKIAPHFDAKQLQLYTLYRGIYKISLEHYVEAFSDLKNAERMFHDEVTIAIILTHLGLLQLRMNNNYIAINHITKAKAIFDQNSNYIKSIQCLGYLGLIWMHMQEYEGATATCLRAVSAAESINNEVLVGQNYRYLALAALHNHKYDMTLEYVKKAIQFSHIDASLCLYAIYASYKIGNEQEANLWISYGRSPRLKQEGINYRRLKLVRQLFQSVNSREKILLEIVESYEKEKGNDSDFFRFFTLELVTLYKSQGNYKMALFYQDKALELKEGLKIE